MTDSDRRLREAERLAHIGSWELDLTTGVTHWSDELRRIFGVDEQFVPGYEAWLRLIHPDDRDHVDRVAREAIAAKVPYELHHRVVWPDGTERVLHCHGALVGDGTKVIGTAQDITERERLHAQLTASIRQREEFLLIASHELRTPLASLQLAVQGLISLVPTDASPEHRLARSVEKSTRRMAALADRLLNDVRLRDAGPLALARTPTDLGEVAHHAAQQFAEALARAGCTVTIEAPQPVIGAWDAQRLEQVVNNLISNAVKFAAGKAVRITVEPRGEHARLVVADEGIGIEPARLSQIFERFERAVSTEHYGGFGLGLYIARQIVEAHGGTITVESKPGHGATFTVELPLA